MAMLVHIVVRDPIWYPRSSLYLFGIPFDLNADQVTCQLSSGFDRKLPSYTHVSSNFNPRFVGGRRRGRILRAADKLLERPGLIRFKNLSRFYTIPFNYAVLDHCGMRGNPVYFHVIVLEASMHAVDLQYSEGLLHRVANFVNPSHKYPNIYHPLGFVGSALQIISQYKPTERHQPRAPAPNNQPPPA